MTPNGAAIFAGLTIAAAMVTDFRGLVVTSLIAGGFAVSETRILAATALRRALALMLPLAAFMAIVWVGIVGRSPADIAAGIDGTRSSAAMHVVLVSLRLFIVIFVMQAAALCFKDRSPLSVIRDLRIPLGAKRVLVLTLSLIETLRHAVTRSHTALVASGVITRRVSVRNILQGWVLIQSVWLTAITTVTGRLRDKWPAENTLARLDPALAQQQTTFSKRDAVWICVSAVLLAILIAEWIHAAP
jgi:hypothetical protein